MSPNQERMPVRLTGVGKLQMALRYFLHERTLSGVISNPMNSEVSALSTNLSGLRMMPYRLQRSNQLTAWVKLSLRLGRYHFFRSQRAGGSKGDQVKISDEKRG